MTLKEEDFPRSVPGSKHVYQGVKYVAINDNGNGCDHCAFNIGDSSQSCDSAPRGCATHRVVWMTPADAITRRLTV